MQLTTQQQAFLTKYNFFAIVAGDVQASQEDWEAINEASEDVFSFEEWEQLCSEYGLC